jgi:hypothetical protein
MWNNIKIPLLLIAISLYNNANAQTKKASVGKRIIKTEQSFTNNRLTNYTENDKNGNPIFDKTDGLLAEGIATINVTEYDSLKREIRSFSVHSNAGFFLTEKEYEGNLIKNYQYTTPDSTQAFSQKLLNKIKSKDAFLNLGGIKALQKGKKQLFSIAVLDSLKNVIREYDISEKGDTLGVDTHQYNSKNQEIYFRMETYDSPIWNWEIYDIYDAHSNLIKTYRIETHGEVRDTTEVYDYVYNSKDKLLSRTYHHQRSFSDKTRYVYDKQSRIAAEYYYENGKSKPAVKTTYLIDKKGKILKETKMDYRKPNNKQLTISAYKTIYTYW